jgi:signal peptidase I
LKRPWQKGDVVTLYCPKTKTTVTKRIIGIGGDTINAFGEYAHEYYYSSRHRRSRYLDTDSTVATAEAAGVPYHPLFPIPFCQQQKFTATATATTTNESSNTSNHNNNNYYYYYYYHYYTVPPNHVWLEGDNPLQSTDSRHYGPVSVMSLRGRVVLRLWPISSSTTSSNRMIDNKRPPPFWLVEWRGGEG